MTNRIRIGTRGSKLALWQAEHVANRLQNSGVDTEIIIIDTKGDQILDVSIAKIGSKGVFTEEIEEQLKIGNIDLAVHSAKDMQSDLPKGFELIAFTEREKVNDVLVSTKEANLRGQALTIGTSSTRRVALLKHYYPHHKTVAVRGNLQTRVSKLNEGICDALILAYAGVHRMGYDHLIQETLSLEEFIPAVGQGSIAVECADNLSDRKKDVIRKSINHVPTEARLLCERAYLKKLQGGCSIPVFALAVLDGEHISIEGGIVSLNGEKRIVRRLTGKLNEAEQIGDQLANEVLAAGGEEILRDIKKTLG